MLFAADLVADLAALESNRSKLDTISTVHSSVYNGGLLRNLVLVNLDLFNGTSADARPSRLFDVLETLGKQLLVRRLTVENSTATIGTTWTRKSVGGDGAVVGAVGTERITDGVVTFLASEAVIVEGG